jgi:quercetin dioxygenase-like cupin family protein
MISCVHFKAGDVSGVMYEFAPGEGLAMHKHSHLDAHITIVTKGSVKVEGPEIGKKVYEAGNQIIDFEIAQAHVITALENGASIINILKRAGR